MPGVALLLQTVRVDVAVGVAGDTIAYSHNVTHAVTVKPAGGAFTIPNEPLIMGIALRTTVHLSEAFL